MGGDENPYETIQDIPQLVELRQTQQEKAYRDLSHQKDDEELRPVQEVVLQVVGLCEEWSYLGKYNGRIVPAWISGDEKSRQDSDKDEEGRQSKDGDIDACEDWT
ncbi:MAG: hypothetical protein LQ337_008037 [Flavoplaca oasis]|nr:MAG: hypothetical protein LQ337_008037 [Flavoplaca oasis]